MPSSARSIAIISLSVCSLGYAHAEEPQRRNSMVRFGAYLGGGMVDWMGKDADGNLPGETAVVKPGFSAGLLATLDVSKLLSLRIEPFHVAAQLEFIYAAKGTELERDGAVGESSIDVNYLEAGLLLRAEYLAESAVPYVVFGPELGVLHSAELNTRFGSTVDIEENLKSTDLGLVLGLGTMYSLPPWGSVGLELRGDLGLVSIDGQGDGDEIRNAALTLLLVYLY